jgi:hypothetical protein
VTTLVGPLLEEGVTTTLVGGRPGVGANLWGPRPRDTASLSARAQLRADLRGLPGEDDERRKLQQRLSLVAQDASDRCKMGRARARDGRPYHARLVLPSLGFGRRLQSSTPSKMR